MSSKQMPAWRPVLYASSLGFRPQRRSRRGCPQQVPKREKDAAVIFCGYACLRNRHARAGRGSDYACRSRDGGLLAIFAAFEREILGERTRAGLAHARQNGKHLGRPAVAAHATEIRRLHRAGVAKAEIARWLYVGRTSVRRTLGGSSRNSSSRRPHAGLPKGHV